MDRVDDMSQEIVKYNTYSRNLSKQQQQKHQVNLACTLIGTRAFRNQSAHTSYAMSQSRNHVSLSACVFTPYTQTHMHGHSQANTATATLSAGKKTAAIFPEEMDMTGCGYNHSRQAAEEVGNTNTYTL